MQLQRSNFVVLEFTKETCFDLQRVKYKLSLIRQDEDDGDRDDGITDTDCVKRKHKMKEIIVTWKVKNRLKRMTIVTLMIERDRERRTQKIAKI